MPNASLSQTAAGTTVDCLNEALEHLMILPVTSLDNIPGGSDAFFVYQRLTRNHRNLQAQGWYCFNRFHRYAPTYDTNLEAYVIPGAIMARTAYRLPTDPQWPQVLLEFPVGASPRLRRTDRSEATGGTAFAVSERNLLVDVTFAKTIDEAPERYRTFLAALTAEEMAPKFGTPIVQGMAANYLSQLKLLEAEYEPKGNVFEDEYDTLTSWLR